MLCHLLLFFPFDYVWLYFQNVQLPVNFSNMNSNQIQSKYGISTFFIDKLMQIYVIRVFHWTE